MGLGIFFSLSSFAQSELRTQIQKNDFFQKLQASYLAQTDIKTAELAKDARHHYPESVVTWYISAKLALKKNDYMKAYEYLLKANEISDDITIDYMLLDVYTNLGEYDALDATYTELLVANPYNTSLLKQYLDFLYDTENYAKFDSELRKAISTAHASPNILYQQIRKLNRLISKRKLKTEPLRF